MSTRTSLPHDVAIITVSYNSSAQLRAFLLNAQSTVSNPAHIFVVDNASSDIFSTKAICSEFKATLLPLTQNLGYGGAINRGVDLLPDEIRFLIVTNPDVELNIDAVSQLRNELDTNSPIGTVGPQIRNTDGSSYPSAREIPSLGNGIGHAIFANIWPTNPWTKKYHSDAFLSQEKITTGWVSGACLGIRRNVFEQVSGFDDNYFMYFEDVDLGYRLHKLGYLNLFIPHAVVTHIGGESTKQVKVQMLRIHHESALRFVSVRYPGLFWAPIRGIVKLGLSLRLKLQIRKAQ